MPPPYNSSVICTTCKCQIMNMSGLIYLFIIFATLFLPTKAICDDSDEVLADVCSRLYKQFEKSLLADDGNVYRLRKAFFYAPNANPVLLKVIYNITFAENVTESAHLQNNYCSKSSSSNSVDETSPTIIDNSTKIVLGWTSNGVFTVFHPLTLNFMQIQIPFLLMKVMFAIFSKIDPTESGPEAVTLLWDGSYDLPTLHINLHFTSIPCISTAELFNSVLRDFNSLLRIYAGQEITGIIQDSGNTHLVGFTLHDFKVSPNDVRDSSDFWFYIVYVISTIILYVTCVTAIFFLASKSKEKVNQSKFAAEHPEVLKGVMIVVVAFIVLEIFTELIMSIIWAVYVRDPLICFIVFLAGLIYYSPGFFSLGKICEKCYLYRSGHYKNHGDPSGHVYFKCFVWTMAYFSYILMYAFFPAFVLSFAYPTRIITIFVFVATFIVFSIVFLTTFLKKGLTLKVCEKYQDKRRNSSVLKIFIFIVMTVILLYFFLFVFALLYSLVIGRASVVSSAPLAILSFLPSILISVLAWIMKSTLLDTTKDCTTSTDQNKDCTTSTCTDQTKDESQSQEQAAKNVIINIGHDETDDAELQD